MSEFVGGDLSQNQKCLINGVVTGVLIVAGFINVGGWFAAAGSGLIAMHNDCFWFK